MKVIKSPCKIYHFFLAHLLIVVGFYIIICFSRHAADDEFLAFLATAFVLFINIKLAAGMFFSRFKIEVFASYGKKNRTQI